VPQPEIRNRTVVFRLTEREYATLRRACSSQKRSISDFARVELLAAIQAIPEHPLRGLESELLKLRSTLEELKGFVSCLRCSQDRC